MQFANGDTEVLALREISFNGFSLWSQTPKAVGNRRIFLIGAVGQPARVVCGTVAHTGRGPAGETRYLSGWSVSMPASLRALEALLGHVTDTFRIVP